MFRVISHHEPRLSCTRRLCVGLIIAMVGIGTLVVDTVRAQEICGFQVFQDLDEPSIGEFGSAMKSDGNVLVIGSPSHSLEGPQRGAVYLYLKQGNGWVHATTLKPALLNDSAAFGSAVAVQGDVIVVGAPGYHGSGPSSGGAFVFRKVPGLPLWNLEQVLTDPDGGAGDDYGVSVATEYDLIAVGSPDYDGDGKVLLYAYNGIVWEDSGVLEPSDGAQFDRYGNMVEIVDGMVVVASPYNDSLRVDGGAVYFYTNDGRSYTEQKITGADSNVRRFGTDLDTDGQQVVISSTEFDGSYTDIVVFTHNGVEWVVDSSLYSGSPSTGHIGFHYTRQVDIDGDTLIHGSLEWDCCPETYEDRTRVWRREGSTWLLEQTINDLKPAQVMLHDGVVFLSVDGCPTCNPPYNAQVQAYAMEVVQDCNGNGISDGCEIDADPSLDCNGNLLIDACEVLDDPSIDCDGNGIIDSCDIADGSELDCNGNGVLDSCDVVTNPALDCDANGVIDMCEIGSLAVDCNDNDVPDACDIAQGVLTDADGDGVPDECVTPGEAGFKYLSADRAMRAFSESIQSSTGWHECDEDVMHLTTLNDMEVTNISDTFHAGAHANQTSTFSHTSMQISMDTGAGASMPHNGRQGEAEAENAVLITFEVLHDGYYDLTGSIVLEQYASEFDPAGSALDTTLVLSSDARAILIADAFDTQDDQSLSIDHTVNLEKDTVYTLSIDTMTPFTVWLEGGQTVLDLRFEPSPMQPCPWDVAGADGMVGVDDFFALLQHWGPCPSEPESCPWDVAGDDDMVGVDDFFALLQHWGPCP